MPEFTVVKHCNVFKDTLPCICMILELLPINPLGFQTLEKGFGHRIALAITGTAHTLNHFVLFKLFPEVFTGILRSSIGMHDQPRCWFPIHDCHSQGRKDCCFCRQSKIACIADDFTAEQLQHYSQV